MKITAETTVRAPLKEVWRAYTTPDDIKQWNAASDDWHTTASEVDLRVGGAFSSRMEAKDGSVGFDFAGTYTKVVPHELIAYSFGDRTCTVEFETDADGVTVRVTFDAETDNPVEQQRQGWQAILDNFAAHVESRGERVDSVQTLRYETTVDAPSARVWDTMIAPDTYVQWVRAFSENSTFEGTWEEGATMHFIDPELGGTKAVLDVFQPYECILARHVALIGKDRGEDTESESAKQWIGTTEKYTFSEDAGLTSLVVEMGTHASFVDMFNACWPKALSDLKDLVEKR